MKKPAFIFLSLFFCTAALGASEALAQKRLHPERWYQDKWCAAAGGKAEVRLPDGCKADCITDTHAIEFDFAQKWHEAIGQSLFYALQTGKRAGIVLILENPLKERKYWIMLNTVIEHYDLPVDAWIIETLIP